MNDQQSNSTQLVLGVDATGSEVTDALVALGFERFAREHKDAFGRMVSAP